MSGKRSRIVISALVGVVLLVLAGLAAMSLFGSRPSNLGVHDGQLRRCPDSPNCVCTIASDAQHAMQPIPFEGSAADALRRVEQTVRSFPRTEIVEKTDNYLHAEFTSAVFRFTDDVEFLIDAEESLIHFRSASRVGRSDLGANRRRMESFREAFEATR